MPLHMDAKTLFLVNGEVSSGPYSKATQDDGVGWWHTMAEPSRVGSSPPPSTSMRALLTPQHSSADSSASTECTLHARA